MDSRIRESIKRVLKSLGEKEKHRKKRINKVEKKEQMEDYIDQVLKKHPEILNKKLKREAERRAREKVALAEQHAKLKKTKEEKREEAVEAAKDLKLYGIEDDADFKDFVKQYMDKLGKIDDKDEAELVDYVTELYQLARKEKVGNFGKKKGG